MVDTAQTRHRQDPVIECRNIWKVFGSRSEEAMRAIDRDALGKTPSISLMDEPFSALDPLITGLSKSMGFFQEPFSELFGQV